MLPSAQFSACHDVLNRNGHLLTFETDEKCSVDLVSDQIGLLQIKIHFITPDSSLDTLTAKIAHLV
jgi:hypothetical protein